MTLCKNSVMFARRRPGEPMERGRPSAEAQCVFSNCRMNGMRTGSTGSATGRFVVRYNKIDKRGGGLQHGSGFDREGRN